MGKRYQRKRVCMDLPDAFTLILMVLDANLNHFIQFALVVLFASTLLFLNE